MRQTLQSITVVVLISATHCFGQDITIACPPAERHPEWMITAIVDDLARLDQLERDHESDSVTIALFNKSIQERIQALDACDQALLQAKIAAQAAGQELAQEQKLRARDRKEITTQKVLKWIGFGLALIMTAIAATK